MNEEQREISKDAQDTRELTTHGGLAQFEQSLDKIPHDALVRNIRNTVADAQDRWEAKWGKGTFDWVVWVGENITNKAVSEGFSNSVRPVKSDSAARLSAAWD